MILLRPFLIHAAKASSQDQPMDKEMVGAVGRCAAAAADTIELIHVTYNKHDFFRTWYVWRNE
jgi:hypothetical protein